MILGIHIAIAISSILYATYLLLSPTRTRVRNSYMLVAATLISGVFMILQSGVSMLRTCITGLIYTSIVTTAIVIAQRKLARETISKK